MYVCSLITQMRSSRICTGISRSRLVIPYLVYDIGDSRRRGLHDQSTYVGHSHHDVLEDCENNMDCGAGLPTHWMRDQGVGTTILPETSSWHLLETMDLGRQRCHHLHIRLDAGVHIGACLQLYTNGSILDVVQSDLL